MKQYVHKKKLYKNKQNEMIENREITPCTGVGGIMLALALAMLTVKVIVFKW